MRQCFNRKLVVGVFAILAIGLQGQSWAQYIYDSYRTEDHAVNKYGDFDIAAGDQIWDGFIGYASPNNTSYDRCVGGLSDSISGSGENASWTIGVVTDPSTGNNYAKLTIDSTSWTPLNPGSTGMLSLFMMPFANLKDDHFAEEDEYGEPEDGTGLSLAIPDDSDDTNDIWVSVDYRVASYDVDHQGSNGESDAQVVIGMSPRADDYDEHVECLEPPTAPWVWDDSPFSGPFRVSMDQTISVFTLGEGFDDSGNEYNAVKPWETHTSVHFHNGGDPVWANIRDGVKCDQADVGEWKRYSFNLTDAMNRYGPLQYFGNTGDTSLDYLYFGIKFEEGLEMELNIDNVFVSIGKPVTVPMTRYSDVGTSTTAGKTGYEADHLFDEDPSTVYKPDVTSISDVNPVYVETVFDTPQWVDTLRLDEGTAVVKYGNLYAYDDAAGQYFPDPVLKIKEEVYSVSSAREFLFSPIESSKFKLEVTRVMPGYNPGLNWSPYLDLESFDLYYSGRHDLIGSTSAHDAEGDLFHALPLYGHNHHPTIALADLNPPTSGYYIGQLVSTTYPLTNILDNSDATFAQIDQVPNGYFVDSGTPVLIILDLGVLRRFDTIEINTDGAPADIADVRIHIPDPHDTSYPGIAGYYDKYVADVSGNSESNLVLNFSPVTSRYALIEIGAMTPSYYYPRIAEIKVKRSGYDINLEDGLMNYALAPTASISASVSSYIYPIANIIDDDSRTKGQLQVMCPYYGTPYIDIDLGMYREVDYFAFGSDDSAGVVLQDYVLKGLVNTGSGDSWVTLATIDDNAFYQRGHKLPRTVIKKFRIQINDAGAPESVGSSAYPNLEWVALYNLDMGFMDQNPGFYE